MILIPFETGHGQILLDPTKIIGVLPAELNTIGIIIEGLAAPIVFQANYAKFVDRLNAIQDDIKRENEAFAKSMKDQMLNALQPPREPWQQDDDNE